MGHNIQMQRRRVRTMGLKLHLEEMWWNMTQLLAIKGAVSIFIIKINLLSITSAKAPLKKDDTYMKDLLFFFICLVNFNFV